MKATIESTDRIVEIGGHEGKTKARVWEGITERGVPFVAYIATVQVKSDADNSQFETELTAQHKKPEPETLKAIDLRFFID